VRLSDDSLGGDTDSLALCPAVNKIVNQGVFGNGRLNHRTEIVDYVDYKEATDRLFDRITAEDLAAELGTSQNAVARARLDPATRGYRPPPVGWERGAARLAGERAAALLRLQRKLEDLGSR
jgi:hypothetical protein